MTKPDGRSTGKANGCGPLQYHCCMDTNATRCDTICKVTASSPPGCATLEENCASSALSTLCVTRLPQDHEEPVRISSAYAPFRPSAGVFAWFEVS